jgi:hypothetical protein
MYQVNKKKNKKEKEITYIKEPEENNDRVCSVCGKTSFQTKEGKDCCPDWKKHKEEKEKFMMVYPNEQTFLKTLN